MAAHPPANFVDVYAAVLPGLAYQPALHVNYESAVLRIRDGSAEAEGLPGRDGRVRRDPAGISREGPRVRSFQNLAPNSMRTASSAGEPVELLKSTQRRS
jgi:hypothetical protein